MAKRSRRQRAADHSGAARARYTARARRRSRRRNLVIAVATAVVAAAALAIGLTVHGSAEPATGPARGGSAALPGVTATKAPWQPSYTELDARLAALHLPPPGDESYHIHAHLAVYVDGARVQVPTDIGIDEATGELSPVHTHDGTGVIHVEAAHPSAAFTLGAFFAVWGVPFSEARIGAYSAHGDAGVQAYVNGHLIDHPAGYHLRERDNIVVGYGPPESFPRLVPFTWPAGE